MLFSWAKLNTLKGIKTEEITNEWIALFSRNLKYLELS